MNKDKIKERNLRYRLDNKESIREYKRKYEVKRRKDDILYKLSSYLRTSISSKIRNAGYIKSSKICQILGCSFEEFKIYIEPMFSEGMSWENYGDWHLDHKIPVSWATSEDEIIKLNHFSNFQPLWASENLSKGNRYCS